MRTIITSIIILLATTIVAQSISTKKCRICGKPLTQCQYRGQHPSIQESASQESSQTYGTSGMHQGHEWVDMGFPSGTKWATCNLGALSPYDFGDYYAWGETSPKSNYSDERYFDYAGKDSNGKSSFKKYNSEGGLTTISPSSGNDAARNNWGGNWRLPTEKEFLELLENTSRKTITHNGVTGLQFTSKINQESFFLPFGGVKYNYDEHFQKNVAGSYWSCDLQRNSNGASALNMNNDPFFSSTISMIQGEGRSTGINIRPVW